MSSQLTSPLTQLLDPVRRSRVLVVGDVMLRALDYALAAGVAGDSGVNWPAAIELPNLAAGQEVLSIDQRTY